MHTGLPMRPTYVDGNDVDAHEKRNHGQMKSSRHQGRDFILVWSLCHNCRYGRPDCTAMPSDGRGLVALICACSTMLRLGSYWPADYRITPCRPRPWPPWTKPLRSPTSPA